jgi:hypothetical protein
MLIGIGSSCLDHRLGRPLKVAADKFTRLSDESLVKSENIVGKFDLIDMFI